MVVKNKKINLLGARLGRWTILREVRKKGLSRQTRWRCRCVCGQVRTVNGQSLRNGRSRSCGCLQIEKAKETIAAVGRSQKGECSPKWKGGKTETKAGYIYIRCEGHPRARGKSHYVFEHIVVMEKKLGRYLRPGETVHHRNGIRNQNNRGNLELRVSIHPAGQKVADLVRFAKLIMKRYGKTV